MRIHTAVVVLRNAHRPWLVPTARRAQSDALAAQAVEFGGGRHVDDPADAFRHGYGSALLGLRLIRDRGVAPPAAHELVHQLGIAHERDAAPDLLGPSAQMDLHNNLVGLRLLGDARDPVGSWTTEAALRERVLTALAAGELVHLAPDAGQASSARARSMAASTLRA